MKPKRFSLTPQRPSSRHLIGHVQALLAIVRPEHLRSHEVYDAMITLSDLLGHNLTLPEVGHVVAHHQKQAD